MANTKGHMISFATIMLIVVTVAASVSVAVTILLIQKHGTTWTSYEITWNIVPVVILTIVLPATLGIVANYLYWRPRYRVRQVDTRRCRTAIQNSHKPNRAASIVTNTRNMTNVIDNSLVIGPA